ncbi:MAG: PAS domain-containing sensor histidine kinase [Thermomicrobiales bacterium]
MADATTLAEFLPNTRDTQLVLPMLDTLPIGFTIVSLRDAGFPTLYQNAWGPEATGWSNEEWERDPDFTERILYPDDRETMLAFKQSFREAPGPYDVEYRMVRPDGGIVWMREWGTVVRDAAGEPNHMMICLIDITAQKTAEQALRDSLAELSVAHAAVEALSQAKSEYLSFVSHELRTPLTSIQGFSELMAGGGLPEAESREFARIIQSNAQRLARMISDLLDMDRLESGRRRVRLGAVHLDTLMLEVLESLAGLGHTHRVAMDIAENLPAIRADSDLLTQVLTNLVSNAMKYTPAEGNILIEMTRPVPGAVEVRVTDTGPGIPPDALETIFQRFTRLLRDEQRQIVGSGLGLPIARQIAELHGGSLRAELAAQGARFVLRLPVAGPDTLPATERP